MNLTAAKVASFVGEFKIKMDRVANDFDSADCRISKNENSNTEFFEPHRRTRRLPASEIHMRAGR